MGEYCNVFKRYEKKYLLNADQYEALLSYISSHLEPDVFPQSRIGSIYYDTPDHLLIRRSLEKPVYKEKLRLRAYCVPGPEDMVFVEMKKKYKGVVYKRRVLLSYRDACAFLQSRIVPEARNMQIVRELLVFLEQHSGIAPSMFIGANRLSYRGLTTPDLRITFDCDIRWRDEILDLSRGDWGAPLLAPGECLMEIKIPDAMPLWLVEALSAVKAYPASYSKYGSAYMCTIKPGKKEIIPCA